MNDNNSKNSAKSNSDSVIRRTGASKNDDKYVFNIEEQTKTEPLYSEEKPVKNGEVYFANYQKNRDKTAAKIYASSYESTKKAKGSTAKAKQTTKAKETLKYHSINEEATQLFDNSAVIAAGKTSRSKYASAMPREDASAQKTTADDLNRKDAKPIERYKNTLEPKNAKERINKRKVNDTDDVIKNFRKEETNNPKEDRKSRRRAKRALKRSQPNYLRKLLVSIISIILATVILSGIGIGCIDDILAIKGTEEEITVTIPENVSTDEVIELLKDAKLIHNKTFCNWFADFRGYSDSVYQSGVYYLSTNMGLEGMLDELRGSNQHTSQEVIKLSFPEGWSVQQIMDKLVKNEAVESNKKFLNALNFEYKYDFIKDSDDLVTKLEGYMFPDTYEFYVGESASSVIRKFLDNFKAKWTQEYQKRADKLGLSVNEIITIASIIQKEAGNTEQMAGVSAVIHNRLKHSVDYPYIQCDSTANYVSKYITEIVGSGKESSYNNYYDTKVRKGLPAGPICNPGEEAIAAALYPDETIDALYFNHDNNGTIYYASNEVEFARNLQEANRINEELSAQYY